MESTEVLIQELIDNIWDPDVNGALLNDLLDEFQKGYPVENILKIIKTGDAKHIRAGAWLASEVGVKVCTIFSDIVYLSRYPDPKVRFYIIDCIICCFMQYKKEFIRLLELLDDNVAYVRWKVLNMMASISLRKIEEGLRHIQSSPEQVELYSSLNRIYDIINGIPTIEQIEICIQSNKSIERKIAFILAIHLDMKLDDLTYLAKLSIDDDIVNFLSDCDYENIRFLQRYYK